MKDVNNEFNWKGGHNIPDEYLKGSLNKGGANICFVLERVCVEVHLDAYDYDRGLITY